MNKHIMVIGAHPDDVELGMGGSIRRFILEGDYILWVEMTTGIYKNMHGVSMRTSEEINAGASMQKRLVY